MSTLLTVSMVLAEPQNTTPLSLYAGPGEGDPLTQGELAILLAIPRAAQNTPDAMLFRLPLGPEPSMGWVDVSCAEAYLIIARLAAVWSTRLSEIMHKRTDGAISSVGPGTTICMLVQPVVHAIFHHLAFVALGCTVQYMSLSLDEDVIDFNLSESGCKIALYSGLDEAWVSGRRDRFDGEMIPLPEDEQAHRLAQAEKQHGVEPTPPWPAPQRPTHALIVNSSGTTGRPKLLRFSLYWYTLEIPLNGQSSLASGGSSPSKPGRRAPFMHPRLIFSPSYWQSFHVSLFGHLVAATPIAFGHVTDILKLPSNQLIPWARGLDVGAITCAPRFLREISTEEFQTHADFLQSLYSIVVTGGAIDDSTSSLIERHQLQVKNTYGMSELGGLLYAQCAPYTRLRLLPSVPPPLVFPISSPKSDGSRQVQLWHSLSTSPCVAHLYARGGVPLKLEPFPGKGPHEGELAVNLGDVFEEVRDPSGSSSDVAFVHLGRSDDLIKLAGSGGWDISASVYEFEFLSTVDTRLRGRSETCQWMLDTVQLFGSNMPCTALIVQLCQSGQAQEEGVLGQDIIEELYNSANEVNEKLELGPRKRVDFRKRMLILTSDTVYGPGSDRFHGETPRLMVTHKHTLQRWKNVHAFKPWLDGLDYSEL